MRKEKVIWWVNHLFEIRKEEYFNKGMMKDAKEVEEAQNMTIEALSERQKGEWILDGDAPICSVCHEEPCWSSGEYDFTGFCPNCGADMRGDTE